MRAFMRDGCLVNGVILARVYKFAGLFRGEVKVKAVGFSGKDDPSFAGDGVCG